jgi:FkbM family methyltransferase
MHPALRGIAYGDTLRDKAVISLHLAMVGLFPVGILARRVGRPLPDPRRSLGGYTVSGPAGVFACPASPSPFFLGAGPGYEPDLNQLIERIEGGLFIDVGASIGFITVRAARRARHVIAVEPHPIRFAHLQRNIELNGLANVTCFNCALGAEEGMATLYDVDPSLGPHPLDASTRPGRGHRYEVPMHRLDDLVTDDAQFVKIDVEGDEPNVLAGARRLLESHPALVVESLDDEHLARIEELLPQYRFRRIDASNFHGTPLW